MLWGIDKTNAMSRGLQESCTRFHGQENAGFAFDPEILFESALFSNQSDQCFRLMGVQLVRDEDPPCLRISVDSALGAFPAS